MKGSYRSPKRIRKKKSAASRFMKIARNPFAWGGFLFVLCGVGVWYGAAFSEAAQVKTVTVSGAATLKQEELESAAWALLPRQVLFGRTASILLVDTGAVQEGILRYDPIISDVTLRRSIWGRALRFHIQERTQEARWCQQECYSVDKQGVVFRATASREDPILVVSGIERAELGARILEEQVMAPLLAFSDLLSHSAIFQTELISIESLDPSQREKAVARSSEGWDIFFDLDSDIDWQASKALAVLEHKISKEERRRLQYIDVRFGDQAYMYPGDLTN
ncbi:MAG: FtsQ-type POTRA domain-containing protein [Candidatus Yanofskybacteria bacterium]|nr:FtsQ-type POTRA domain-containing protein [Candidatus Yanofskybacteria bacterium]